MLAALWLPGLAHGRAALAIPAAAAVLWTIARGQMPRYTPLASLALVALALLAAAFADSRLTSAGGPALRAARGCSSGPARTAARQRCG